MKSIPRTDSISNLFLGQRRHTRNWFPIDSFICLHRPIIEEIHVEIDTADKQRLTEMMTAVIVHGDEPKSITAFRKALDEANDAALRAGLLPCDIVKSYIPSYLETKPACVAKKTAVLVRIYELDLDLQMKPKRMSHHG